MRPSCDDHEVTDWACKPCTAAYRRYRRKVLRRDISVRRGDKVNTESAWSAAPAPPA